MQLSRANAEGSGSIPWRVWIGRVTAANSERLGRHGGGAKHVANASRQHRLECANGIGGRELFEKTGQVRGGINAFGECAAHRRS